MTGHLFYYYREFSVKALGWMLNVKFSCRREWNKDNFFGLERLNVDGNSVSYSTWHFLVLKALSDTLSSIICFL